MSRQRLPAPVRIDWQGEVPTAVMLPRLHFFMVIALQTKGLIEEIRTSHVAYNRYELTFLFGDTRMRILMKDHVDFVDMYLIEPKKSSGDRLGPKVFRKFIEASFQQVFESYAWEPCVFFSFILNRRPHEPIITNYPPRLVKETKTATGAVVLTRITPEEIRASLSA